MADTDDILEPPADTDTDAPPEPRPKAPPIESRFLYVDVAAMRAKQLRRGALPRLEVDDLGVHGVIPKKAERVAMEEVKRGLVLYELPGTHGTGPS